MDTEKLRKWFLESKREFPWRDNPTPYQVLVSEVMLQQTRASVVIPYYERWMQRFPTLEALALASEEEVIKLWEGLGYYSRARSLHKAAQWIVSHYQGVIPRSKSELESIPGIGPYTSGAIRSFAFHEKAPAIDGNVARVLARHLALDLEISTPAAKKRFYEYLEEMLTVDQGWIEMEALIELGATHCSKTPQCLLCPLRGGCKAYKEGSQKLYPVKKKPKETVRLSKQVFCLLAEKSVLIRKNPKGQIMADLWEFPSCEEEKERFAWTEGGVLRTRLSRVKHGFTHFEVSLIPSFWEMPFKHVVEGYEWVSFQDLIHLPFSAGHRKILQELLEFLEKESYVA